MAQTTRLPGVSAEEVVTAVRVHADRVHDAVRRLGCDATSAVEVVDISALDLVDVVASRPETVKDAVGWWAARAQDLGRQAARPQPPGQRAPGHPAAERPLGGGVLSSDEDQVVLSEALGGLPERDRVLLLLRDSYALPADSVGAALGADAETALELVGRARLAFLPLAQGGPAPAVPAHAPPLAALARLGEGGPVAARDATPRRHAQSCGECGAVLQAQRRAHTLLAGLTVVALPPDERARLLERVEEHARALLPAEADLLVPLDDEDDAVDDRRLLSPLVAVLALVLAVALGTVLGLLLSRETRPAAPTTLAVLLDSAGPLVGPPL